MSVLTTAAISATEVQAVQDGIWHDVRGDGRTLLQRRPVTIGAVHAQGFEEEAGSYNGSRVAVSVGSGTTVLAAASPSVVEVAVAEEGGSGLAPLHITIDAAPAVVDFYGGAVGGRSNQSRRTYLAHVALAIRHVFGAESVSVEERQSGVAEAQMLSDEEGPAQSSPQEDMGGDDGAATAAATTSSASGGAPAVRPEVPHRRLPTGYPSKDLYIGEGYAFRVDVDVHVQQASEGNLLSCVALAVHAALRTMRLPRVTLHEATSGVSVEVDWSKPYHKPIDWSRLPLLCVLLLSPTRHYITDPTPVEELALPQQLHVAASRDGHVCYAKYCQYPSRSGGDKLKQMLFDRSPQWQRRSDGGSNAATALHAAQYELYPMDFVAAVGDATHICEAMIAECDEAISRMV